MNGNEKAVEKKKRKLVAEADHRDESAAAAVEVAAEVAKAALAVELVALAAAVVVPSAVAVASYCSPPQPQQLLLPHSLANRRG